MPARKKPTTVRNLVVIVGDQLDRESSAFDGFDPATDCVWMAEVREESTHVWSHQARIVLFLSAMRHFRDALLQKQYRVEYRLLDDPNNLHSLAEELIAACKNLNPEKVIFVEPGDYRVRESLLQAIRKFGIDYEERIDRHFLSTIEEFRNHAKGRKQLRMEFFYREMRRKHQVLMDGEQPEGGDWNYDSENRGSFGKTGPKQLPAPKRFLPDSITKEVIALVRKNFPDHPGKLDSFDWPVTPDEAKQALDDFIAYRLNRFGEYQDAMWTAEPWLYHSRISSSLNLKLLNPRVAIQAAEAAYRQGRAPLAAVEGFIRQILGWREYVRGIYWLHMPGYLETNALGATYDLPQFYWTGKTDMQCLSQALRQTLDYGYAHHIQRLMVTGLFSLLYGVEPKQIHEWYLAVYVDAIEWVEVPNTVGMSQFADGGIMASKPYAASGKYIQRMSNYCSKCKYAPDESTGERACPFTTLYWDFLIRHEERLLMNQRMSMQVRNLNRLSSDQRKEIQQQAKRFRQSLKVIEESA